MTLWTQIIIAGWVIFMAWILKEIYNQLRKPRGAVPKITARQKYDHDTVDFEQL